MRRDFLRYIERERAHPYRPSMQYNTWYDLGFNNRTDETGARNRIHAFGRELTEKRGATVQSFVFDDGWDNPNSLWGFDSGFPDGFEKVGQAAAQYHSHIGVWMPTGAVTTSRNSTASPLEKSMDTRLSAEGLRFPAQNISLSFKPLVST